MSLPALVVLFLASAAAAKPPASVPVPADIPSESKARANGALYLDQFCLAFARECQAAKDVFKDYQAAVAAAGRCRTQECSPDRLRTLSTQVRAIDQRQGLLPSLPPPERGRPLLQLSAIASARLAAAAAKTKNPYSVAETESHSDVGLDLVAEKACLKGLAACGDLRDLTAQGKALRAELAACASSPCAFDAVDGLVVRGTGALSRYLDIDSGTDSLSLFSLLNDDRTAAVGEMAKLVAGSLSALSSSSGALDKKLDALGLSPALSAADAMSLRRDGAALFETYRRVEVGADRLNYILGYEKTSAVRGESAPWAGRLASQRARGLALLAARGFAASGADDAPLVAPGASAGKNAAAAATSPAARPTLLDRRSVPPLVADSPPAPPIMPGEASPLELARRLRSDDPVANADARRRLGLTKTFGSPGLYAPQAYAQDGGDTCAIAVQVEILRAHGLLPPGDPVPQERALAADADRRGFRGPSGGTPPEYNGDLLTERGLLVSKRLNASWSDLEAALRRGHVAQVGVDARVLWNVSDPKRLGHSILVTGLEVSKNDDQALGIYINDTGSLVPSAGRFVAKKTFLDAWSKDFAEVQ